MLIRKPPGAPSLRVTVKKLEVRPGHKLPATMTHKSAPTTPSGVRGRRKV